MPFKGLPFSYEDRFPGYTPGSGFGCTNEEPQLIFELVPKFKKGLGIASAGEVTFFSLLPKCSGELVLIDHSYYSLRAFCIKALLLAQLGAEATKKLLSVDDKNDWMKARDKVAHFLPDTFTPGKYSSCYFLSHSYSIAIEWKKADLTALKKAVKNLHKIKLIHGDLRDMDDRAPYDLVYLSNALEHVGRSDKPSTSTWVNTEPPNVDGLTKMFKPAATIIWTTANSKDMISGTNKLAAAKWGIKSQQLGVHSSWYYNLSQLATGTV